VLYQWRTLVPAYEVHLTPIRNIHVKNVTVDETETPFTIAGDARVPVKDVFLENITVRKATGAAKSFKNVENVREQDVRIVELVKTGNEKK
jgi:hypothetical protein